MKAKRIGDAWCNQHDRYEVVFEGSYIPGTTIPHDPHTPSAQAERLKARDTLTRIKGGNPMKYTIPYEVPAETHLEALIRAGELVRTGVTIEAVKRVEPSVPGWYFVDMEVSEPESARTTHMNEVVTCFEAGHVLGCAGASGGDHELV